MRLSPRPAAKNSPTSRAARRTGAATLALALALPLSPATHAQESAVPKIPDVAEILGSKDPVGRSPERVTDQEIPGLPDGVSVDRVEWITDRWVNLYINSAVMPKEPVKVQILLARDWHSQPDRTFPSVLTLDGLRAIKEESGWTLQTNAASFFADKNVNVIMPVGGASSFYADWKEPDNGTHYMWESFLTKELPAVLEKGWRTNQDRAVVGLSMGGTGAMNLAQRHPEMFKFVGSFSGYLDTTTYGMPEAIDFATHDSGGFDAQRMWGPYGSEEWKAHDPKLHIKNLKDMTVYVSAGNGNTGPFDRPGAIEGLPENLSGAGLEVASRLTTETFVQRAAREGVDVISKFRDSGTHSWPYWQYEMTEAWPHIAEALNIPENDRGSECVPSGAIGAALSSRASVANRVSACLSPEYDGAKGGKIQDFRSGRAYWSEATGAHFLWGRIGARYAEMGATESWLGYPTSEEIRLPDGKGRFVTFENGSIYWNPETGAVPVRNDMIDIWGTIKGANGGWEKGPLGLPISAAKGVGDGQAQRFQNGLITRDAKGRVAYVRGEIAKKYLSLGAQASDLGYPISGEIPLADGGAFSRFEKGYIYFSPKNGAKIIKNGAIFDAWGEEGYENGSFGFPVADQSDIPAGGREVKFENGVIREINGHIEKISNQERDSL